MSRRMLVVCFTMIVLTAAVSFGQTQCPKPATRVAQVQPAKVDFTSDTTVPNPQLAYVLATNNALQTVKISGPSGSTLYSDNLGTQSTVVWSTTVSGTSATTTVSGLPANTPVQATATVAASTCTTSAPSAPVVATTAPAPPTGISGLGGLLKVTVSWANSPGATSYQLTLSNGMSFTVPAGSVTLASGKIGTSFVVTGLQTATSYNAILASINSFGTRGAFSQAVVVRTANVALQ